MPSEPCGPARFSCFSSPARRSPPPRLIIRRSGSCNRMYWSKGKWPGIRSACVSLNVLSKWAGEQNKTSKPGQSDRCAPGLQGFDFGQINICFSKCFYSWLGWIEPDVKQSPPPPRRHCPSAVLSNGALRRGSAPVRPAQRSGTRVILSRALWVFESEAKMSARAHSSLMFTDEETGEPQQAIVSSKWCPLIARKPRLFLVSDGWSSF